MGSKNSLPDPVRDMAVKYIEDSAFNDLSLMFVHDFISDELESLQMHMSEDEQESLAWDVYNKLQSARVIVKFADER